MWWQYLLVLLCTFLVDVAPLPLPAFTVMILLQITFGLSIWPVIIIGVIGSVLGRYVLTLYVPHLSSRIFKQDKNDDVKYLGQKLSDKGWKSQAFVLVYSLMPLPTTPLFLAAGMARMSPLIIIPAFFVGKFISDTVAVLLGKYAAENTVSLMEGMVSWQSLTGLGAGLLLLCALILIDWRTLLRERRFTVKFNIWK